MRAARSGTVTSLVRLSMREWLTVRSTGVTRSTQWADSDGLRTGTFTMNRRRSPRTRA